MPTLDVSEVLTDPAFAEMITIIRRSEALNQYGESVQTSQTLTAVGVVTSGRGELVRAAEQQHMPRNIVVHSKFRMRGPSPGYQPDVISWHGNSYVVSSLRDWSNFGAGYTAAECQSIDHIDQPPQEAPDGQ